MRAGAEPLRPTVLSAVSPFLSLIARVTDLGREDVVWLVTIVALAIPLVVLPLLDRLLRKH